MIGIIMGITAVLCIGINMLTGRRKDINVRSLQVLAIAPVVYFVEVFVT